MVLSDGYEFSTISLSAIVQEACEYLRSRSSLKAQVLETELISDAWIFGDPSLVRRLVIILIENAIKYTPVQGYIKVSVTRMDGCLQLDVLDNGMGIAAEDLPKIFDRFYRADASRNRDEGGSGLGLAIAKWIARIHATDIDVCSDGLSGTNFSVSFLKSESRVPESTLAVSKLK